MPSRVLGKIVYDFLFVFFNDCHVAGIEIVCGEGKNTRKLVVLEGW